MGGLLQAARMCQDGQARSSALALEHTLQVGPFTPGCDEPAVHSHSGSIEPGAKVMSQDIHRARADDAADGRQAIALIRGRRVA